MYALGKREVGSRRVAVATNGCKGNGLWSKNTPVGREQSQSLVIDFALRELWQCDANGSRNGRILRAPINWPVRGRISGGTEPGPSILGQADPPDLDNCPAGCDTLKKEGGMQDERTVESIDGRDGRDENSAYTLIILITRDSLV